MSAIPPEIRFWKYVEKTDTCWNWIGAISNVGYGQLKLVKPTRQCRAHRFSWELHNKQRIPDGMIIRHKCDNRRCVNPDHLETGTHQDNSNDKVTKLRHTYGNKINTAKLNDEMVLQLRKEFVEDKITRKELAKKYGIAINTMYAAVNGINWKQV